MYLLTLALLVSSAAAAATDLFRRWDYSAMESHPLQKREIVDCAAPVNGDASCASTCGPGYASCLSTNPVLCYSESNGESCCGNGFMCFTGFYCDPKGCCPNGVSSADCVPAPITILSSAAGPRATGSSSTTGSKGAGSKSVNNEALGLVMGGLGVLFTL